MNHAEANKPFLVRNNEGISANLLHAEENVKFSINKRDLINNNLKFGSRIESFTRAGSFHIRHIRAVNYALKSRFT